MNAINKSWVSQPQATFKLTTLFFVLSLFAAPLASYAQPCCTNQVYPSYGFETTATIDSKFPNATITTVNNSTKVPTWFENGHNDTGIDGWFVGVPQATTSSGYLINDATRASEGAQFWYIPAAVTNTNSGNSICLQSSSSKNLIMSTTCAPYNVQVGKRYIVAVDYVPFNILAPTGGTGAGVSHPVFELAGGGFSRFTFYNSVGVTIVDEPAVAWANVKTSWKRGWLVITPSATDQNTNFSILETATAGMLFDNSSILELTMTASGISAVSCGASSSSILFSLNPVSNVGGVPGLKYNVTAPAGYTVSPTQGTYGQTTNFTLTKSPAGSFASTPATIDITIADEVNTTCSIVETITNPCIIPCGLPDCLSATVQKN